MVWGLFAYLMRAADMIIKRSQVSGTFLLGDVQQAHLSELSVTTPTMILADSCVVRRLAGEVGHGWRSGWRKCCRRADDGYRQQMQRRLVRYGPGHRGRVAWEAAVRKRNGGPDSVSRIRMSWANQCPDSPALTDAPLLTAPVSAAALAAWQLITVWNCSRPRHTVRVELTTGAGPSHRCRDDSSRRTVFGAKPPVQLHTSSNAQPS
jgi:hypothetical protein